MTSRTTASWSVAAASPAAGPLPGSATPTATVTSAAAIAGHLVDIREIEPADLG